MIEAFAYIVEQLGGGLSSMVVASLVIVVVYQYRRADAREAYYAAQNLEREVQTQVVLSRVTDTLARIEGYMK
jgi:hypothetical protein